MPILMLCNCKLDETILNPIQEPKMPVELEAPRICANFVKYKKAKYKSHDYLIDPTTHF